MSRMFLVCSAAGGRVSPSTAVLGTHSSSSRCSRSCSGSSPPAIATAASPLFIALVSRPFRSVSTYSIRSPRLRVKLQRSSEPSSHYACTSFCREGNLRTSVPHVPRLNRINLRSCKSYYYTVLFSLFDTERCGAVQQQFGGSQAKNSCNNRRITVQITSYCNLHYSL
eukprot:COSAG02_NODE_7825_length_2832_cov_1.204903_5_plen_168_part_00